MRILVTTLLLLAACGSSQSPSVLVAFPDASEGFLYPWDAAQLDLGAPQEVASTDSKPIVDAGKDVSTTDARDVQKDKHEDGVVGPDPGAAQDASSDGLDSKEVPPPPCQDDEECDDGNPCTDDKCGPAGCLHAFNTAPCDDQNPCTEGDRCLSGKCVGQFETVCDDGDPCTTDSCKPGLGCVHEPLTCDDGNPCTKDKCSKEQGGCVFEPKDGKCDDGDPCTVKDKCIGGQCVGMEYLDCDDGDPCTVDYCDSSVGCVHQPIDGCQQKCSKHSDCDDGDPCTSDLCNPATKTCEHIDIPSCKQWCSDSKECQDDDPCTADICFPLLGCANVPVDDCEKKCWSPMSCGDGDPCTLNGCDSATNHCYSLPNPECEDECETAVDCQDDDPCTIDLCVYDLGGWPIFRCANLPTDHCEEHED